MYTVLIKERSTKILRPIEKLIEKRKEEFIRNNLMSDEFIDFIQKNKKPMDKLLSYYACAIMEVETKFRVLDHQYSLEYDRNPIEDIKSRVKSWESLIKKVRRKEIPLTLSSIEENIHDIAGVRVICPFITDVYHVAAMLMNQTDVEVIRVKDYIEHPKDNGYRSLHVIVMVDVFFSDEKKKVPIEIQFRTIAMNFWASTEHQLRYKKEEKFTPEMHKQLKRCADLMARADRKMQRLAEQCQTEEGR